MWDTIAPWLGAGGATGIVGMIVWGAMRLHTDAVAAERRRADDHKEAARTWQAVASEQRRQLDILLGRVKDPTP